MAVSLPHWAEFLQAPFAPDGERVRHRVLHGGRGGAKSWTIALLLALRARVRPIRILCVREYQNSIRDSSKRLIEESIDRLGLGARGDQFFSSNEREVRGRNGSIISFLGLNGKEASIKSLEGIDIVWVEEAATITQASVEALIPTIRREGSELWWSYNPRYPTDPVDVLFRGAAPPPGSIILKVGWRDNPWFPDVLKRDMEYDLRRDPEKHAHVWEGSYILRSEARVFQNWTVFTFEAPEEAIFRQGADWGFSTDPTVLVRCFIGRWEGEPGASAVVADSKGRCLFIDYEAYKVGCAIDETPALFAGTDRRVPARWQNAFLHTGIPDAAKWPITADNARPETIDYMQKRGFSIEAATKGKGSIEDGIEFLRTYDIYVHPRCRHLVDELTHYSWVVDRHTGAILPKLADTNNHVIDALRYALEGVRRARSSNFVFASAGRRVFATSDHPGFLETPMDHYLNLGRGSGWGSRSRRFGRGFL